MLPWYLAAPVNAGSSAKRIFPVLLLQIDSPTYIPQLSSADGFADDQG